MGQSSEGDGKEPLDKIGVKFPCYLRTVVLNDMPKYYVVMKRIGVNIV